MNDACMIRVQHPSGILSDALLNIGRVLGLAGYVVTALDDEPGGDGGLLIVAVDHEVVALSTALLRKRPRSSAPRGVVCGRC